MSLFDCLPTSDLYLLLVGNFVFIGLECCAFFGDGGGFAVVFDDEVGGS